MFNMFLLDSSCQIKIVSAREMNSNSYLWLKEMTIQDCIMLFMSLMSRSSQEDQDVRLDAWSVMESILIIAFSVKSTINIRKALAYWTQQLLLHLLLIIWILIISLGFNTMHLVITPVWMGALHWPQHVYAYIPHWLLLAPNALALLANIILMEHVPVNAQLLNVYNIPFIIIDGLLNSICVSSCPYNSVPYLDYTSSSAALSTTSRSSTTSTSGLVSVAKSPGFYLNVG